MFFSEVRVIRFRWVNVLGFRIKIVKMYLMICCCELKKKWTELLCSQQVSVCYGSRLKAESHLPFLILVHLRLYVFYFYFIFYLFIFLSFFFLDCFVDLVFLLFVCLMGFFLGFLLHNSTPQVVWFLCPQGSVILQKL